MSCRPVTNRNDLVAWIDSKFSEWWSANHQRTSDPTLAGGASFHQFLRKQIAGGQLVIKEFGDGKG